MTVTLMAVGAVTAMVLPESVGASIERSLRTDPQKWFAPSVGSATIRQPRVTSNAPPLARFGARRLKLSAESDSFETARSLLPERFVEYESTRFVIMSDAKPRWTRTQAGLLERTYHQFNRYCRRLGLTPQPLRHKLVCVLFEDHADYQQFARAHDGVTAEWISGYYSPMHDRIVFYNIQTNPAFADAFVPRAASQNNMLASNRIADDYAKAATATTVHEAVHQLAFHTRIQSPHIQNPLWISEGLATAFETDQTNKAFGPEFDYAPRRRQFQKLLETGELIPLRKLVGYTEMPGNDDDTITAVYHESYALVTWLSRYRRRELQGFLRAMTSEPPGRPSAQRHLAIFQNAFGDVDTLERAWLRSERDKMDE